MSAVEQAELEVHIDALQAKVEALQDQLVSPAPSRDSGEPMPLDELASVSHQLEQALSSRAESAAKTAAQQRESAEAHARADSLGESLASAEERYAEAEKRRTAAKDEAAELAQVAVRLDRPPGATVLVQTAALPQLRPSNKHELGIYVRFGRFFMMHAWRNGQRLGPNVEQFVVAGNSPQVARPRPEKGIPIEEDTIDRDLAALLQPFSSDSYVIGFVVFDDSFAAFQVLKAAVVRMGYEYRPIPVKSGGSVLDTGGTAEAQ
jgi:hypothetical protein